MSYGFETRHAFRIKFQFHEWIVMLKNELTDRTYGLSSSGNVSSKPCVS